MHLFQHPKQISLVCVGPLTNIALALKTFPEIKENIKEVYIMGGNHKGWLSNVLLNIHEKKYTSLLFEGLYSIHFYDNFKTDE